jgi:tetratricopeptide (TPR) repeat protein
MAPNAPIRSALPPDVRTAVERAAADLFVGRVRELVQLDAALGEAIDGRGRLCLIAGEPGIGKTRLAECVAARAAERGATVIWGRCWEGEGAPAFWPWVQVLRALLRQCDVGTLAGWLGAGAPYIAQVVSEVRELLPDLPAAPALDSEQARFRLYDAVSTFLRSAAGGTPLVLVLDDLHWADQSSLLLLQFFVREIADARLLIVGTYRDVEVSRDHPLGDVLPRLRRERSVDRILLRGLPDAEVHAMLVALRGGEVPEDFARTISRETAGNPFFIMEILRHLLDEGIAYREGDQWVGRVEPSEIRLPDSVREVIGRRLSRLGDTCAKLLTLAAVIGKEFGLDVLQRVSNLDEERVFEVLEEALAAGIVGEVPRTIARYRFSHTLVRETLYGELRNLERVRLHRRVADVLEALYAEYDEPHLAELAHHFLEGLPGGDVEKAVAYSIRAGDRANEQLAYAEAATQYERALQALELSDRRDERRRCELLLKLGETAWSTGGAETAKVPLQEAAMLAERLGDPNLFARAALLLEGPAVGIQAGSGDADRIALLERALAALGDRDSALRACVMGRLAGLRTFAGVPTGKESLGRAALEMARRIGNAHALAYVLGTTPWSIGSPDDVVERLARADELIRVATGAGDERLAAEGHAWKSGYYLEIGDMEAVDRETEIHERFAETSRHVFHRWMATMTRGSRALLAGRFDEGDRLMQQALEIMSGVRLGDAWASLLHGVGMQGYRNLQLEQQGRSHELLPAVGNLAAAFPQIPLWRTAAAAYRVDVGQTEEARKDLDALAANDFGDIPRDLMWLYVLSRLCEVVSFFADEQRAAILYDLVLPYADRCATTSFSAYRGSVSRPLGLLATVLGRYDDAERHFEKALAMNARIRARVWVTHTQHDYARMLVARDRPGDRERATVLAAEALSAARQIGMKPLVAKLLDLRAAAGIGDDSHTEPAPEGQPTALTVAVFQREGDYWTIAYDGKRIRLRDAKGLQYIAHLLRHDGREFHAADLAAGVDGATVSEPTQGSAETIAAGLGDAGEALDASARAAYRQRLQDLEAELAEATEWADAGRITKLGAEIEFVRDELSGAYGLGGRARKAADVGDRARKAVTSRIRESIDRIGKEHPALARHFENAIHTGTFCSYQPDRPLRWEV